LTRLAVLPVLLLPGCLCGSSFFGGDGDDAPVDSGPDADTDTDTDTGSDTESESDVPECEDDRLEDNNHDGEAVAVEDGEIVEDLVVCHNDDDWFSIPLTVGQFLEVTVRYAHSAQTDLGAQVIGQDGEVVLYSINSEDDDEIVRWWPWEAIGDGTYFFRVFGRPSPGGELDRTPYTVEFDVQDEVPCFPDDHEEDDAPDEAGALPPEDEGGDYTMCPADADFFEVDVPAGNSVVALTKYYSPHGHLDLDLLDETGSEVLATAFDYDPLDEASVFGREHLAFAPKVAGRYLLRVSGAADTTNEYALIAVLRDPCTDDAFEENDFVPWAAPLSPGTYDAQICWVDIDWYAFELAEGQTVMIDVLFSQALDTEDLDAYLFAPDTVSELDASSSADANEDLTTIAIETGTHYVVVQGFEDAENDYALDLRIE